MEQSQSHQMKTALYEHHRALGAKMVDFCGWEMAVQYQGIIAEHHIVRQHVGLFDVSHMGRILVEGPDAEKLLDLLSTNRIAGKANGSATYTVWSHPEGGCVDDVIVYRQDPTHFFVIVNAGNRQKDLQHVLETAKRFEVRVQDRYQEDGIIAMQGPKAISLMGKFFPEAQTLKPMHFVSLTYKGIPLILSATGYTGAGGFEIYAPHAVIVELWEKFLAEGKLKGIAPIGLGARDTLRLEMGYALYGHEISDTISANESVSAWTIKWDKPNFIGKEAMQHLERSPNKRYEYGIVMTEPGIARADYPVFNEGAQIGNVTSGTQSPTLGQAVAIILVRKVLQEGEVVEIQIRQHRCKAKVVKLPFIGSSIF